jgi:predicted N-acetyltransferase YhbS
MDKVIIRKTEPSEFFLTEKLTREAFWNLYKPGCDEHLVLHQLRNSKSYLSELDLIAVADDQIIGHIICTRAIVTDMQGFDHEVLCAGPFAVWPELQNRGTGNALMRYSIALAREMSFTGIILFGNPEYYKKFGFVNAQKFEITTKDGQNFDPFMALELQPGGLSHVKGRFFEDEAFTTVEEELIEFEKKFPLKEKGAAKIDISQFLSA